MKIYEFLYRDASNYKTTFFASFKNDLNEKDELTIQELGFENEQVFCDRFTESGYNMDTDHNFVHVYSVEADIEDVIQKANELNYTLSEELAKEFIENFDPTTDLDLDNKIIWFCKSHNVEDEYVDVITVTSSYGTLTVDANTGQVLKCESDSEEHEYINDVVSVDLDEFMKYSTELSELPKSIDIVDLNITLITGEVIPADLNHRNFTLGRVDNPFEHPLGESFVFGSDNELNDLPEEYFLTQDEYLQDKVKEQIPHFPNGFNSWQQTHYQVVEFITNYKNKFNILRTKSLSESIVLMSEAEMVTNEFERLFSQTDWVEFDWIDTLNEFLHNKYFK